MQADVTESDRSTALLQAIASGDEAALRAFYNHHHRQIYAFALKRLGDPHEAAEVLNEVMLVVWRSAGNFQGRSQALTWVLGIAHHKVFDRLRKRSQYATEELDPELEDSDSPAVGAALSGAQDARLVQDCLAKLSDAHQQVVHLAFFEDLSYTEIARIVDCPEGTVKTRMFHAKQLLKRCLERRLAV